MHAIYACPKFSALSVEDRTKDVKQFRYCLNCLRPGHLNKDCRSSKCKHCGKLHNSLLHIQTVSSNNNANQAPADNSTQSYHFANDSNNPIVYHSTQNSNALLSTAVVHVIAASGEVVKCRVLLDSGSESNFIIQHFCKKLNLPTFSTNLSIKGIGHVPLHLTQRTSLKIFSRTNSYSTTLSCLVLPKITENIPATRFDKDVLEIPENITLADPSFNEPNTVDLLVGATTFYEILSIGHIKLQNSLRLQKTLIGWVVSGPLPVIQQSHCNLACDLEIKQLERFFELEEVSHSDQGSKTQDEHCETLFVSTTTRDELGHFVVNLPLKDNIHHLVSNKDSALSRFKSLEKKFSHNPSLKAGYSEFMQEYITLGHMTKIDPRSHIFNPDLPIFFLPHHAVIRDDSLTTKLRVVFDGSASCPTGVSLNDTLHVGPVIQDELFCILVRFRQHSIVITADITKMYRQVNINPAQRQLQQILWRFDSDFPVDVFQLNTVTYGTASASFLAIRALHQIALDNREKYPEASQVILRDFYVDDLLTGSDTEQAATKLAQEVNLILNEGGFPLRKWSSNHPSIFQNFSESQPETINLLNNHPEFKALGVQFNPHNDQISYSVADFSQQPVTKRAILSSLAQLFDPLGLLSPITVRIKIVIQSLWKNKLSWDESLSAEMHFEWINIRHSLSDIHNIKVKRHVLVDSPVYIELHGFADASEKAYAACVYFKSVDSSGRTIVALLCAKTRVAPLKKITLPRLELSACLLLTRLVTKVKASISVKVDKMFMWTDSQIALAWIKANPSRWHEFVSNRTREIQGHTTLSDWNYIPSKQNPADVATRGITARELIHHQLWWTVPWLETPNQPHFLPPDSEINLERIPEQKPVKKVQVFVSNNTVESDIVYKYGTLGKLQRVFAYVLRFIHNLRQTPDNRITECLSVSELNHALLKLVGIIQKESFSTEIQLFENKQSLPKNSNLLSLSPFLDDKHLLRVGGRLAHSNFNYNNKHPILLPKNHQLTILIFQQFHITMMHCGPQLLLAAVREHFWPIGGRQLSKTVVHNCVICFKAKPTNDDYLMGQLPNSRLDAGFPFKHVGVDYMGPILIKDKLGRGSKTRKAYVAVFVCLCVKAMHLEVVTDLTSLSMLSALKRFCARRGKPFQIFSDNGTNFVGADKELKQVVFQLADSNIKQELAEHGIAWHFIPSSSPHFGGIWEAGVKSVKYHLRRVMSNHVLDYEQLSTVLQQIEAILNSRPLYSLSSDPSDPSPLTPGHFLIGRPMSSTPEPSYLETADNRLNNYELRQKIVQSFWKRWSVEYISTLQAKIKWHTQSNSLLKKGALVIVKADNLPPLKWQLGRIVDLHPGSDGIIRVVTLKYGNSIVKRPVTKICVLPIPDEPTTP